MLTFKSSCFIPKSLKQRIITLIIAGSLFIIFNSALLPSPQYKQERISIFSLKLRSVTIFDALSFASFQLRRDFALLPPLFTLQIS